MPPVALAVTAAVAATTIGTVSVAAIITSVVLNVGLSCHSQRTVQKAKK